MSELNDRMIALKNALAAQYPARRVTRVFRPLEQIPDADLAAGVYSLVAGGEGEFTNVAGYSAKDGKQAIILVAQLKVAPINNAEADGEAVEAAELAIVDEVKAFCNALPATLCQLDLTGWGGSRQMDAPYGWVAFDLEYRP